MPRSACPIRTSHSTTSSPPPIPCHARAILKREKTSPLQSKPHAVPCFYTPVELFCLRQLPLFVQQARQLAHCRGGSDGRRGAGDLRGLPAPRPAGQLGFRSAFGGLLRGRPRQANTRRENASTTRTEASVEKKNSVTYQSAPNG